MKQTAAPKPKGRPRAYDPEQVLECVLDTFWRKGFAATSLDDLVAATGVNRPSLYAGFGDKQALYLLALDRFKANVGGRIAAALKQRLPGESAADVLERCFSTLIDIYTADPAGGLGCAVFCTSVTEAPCNAEIRSVLHEALNEIDALYEAFLRQAQADGELPKTLDAAATARLLSATMQSLGIRARGGHRPEEIRRVGKAAADLLRVPRNI